MANRLVAVDDSFNLPPEVRAQLQANIEGDLEHLVIDAQTSADTATAAKNAAETAANTATTAAGTASSAADTAEQVSTELTELLDDWVIDSSDVAVTTLVENPASQTRQALDDLYEFDPSQITAQLDNTPTFEEQSISFPLSFGSITSTVEVPLYTALFPCTIEQASMTAAASVLTSATSFWAVRFVRYRDGMPTVIARKSTEPVASGGEAIAAFNHWDFDLVEFSSRELIKGDVLTVRFQYQGSPAAIERPSMTFRINAADNVQRPASTLVAYDTFRRANASSLGTSTGGGTWTSTNWTIASDTATSAGTASAVMETGVADCTVEGRILLRGDSGSTGLIFRYQDDDNYWGITNSNLFKRVAGSVTYITDQAIAEIVTEDTVRAVLSGNVIKILVDRGSTGVYEQVVSLTDAFCATATKHGMRASGSSAHKIDNWQVTVP